MLGGGGEVFEVGADGLVGGGVGEDLGVGNDAPVLAGLAIDFGPPVAVLGKALLTPAFPVHEDAGPAFVAVADGLLGVGEFLEIPVAADAGVEDFVGPIVVLEEGGEGVVGGEANFPFEAFAGAGHEALLDVVEDGVAFEGLELGVEGEGPGVVDHDLDGPVDAEVGKADFAHHGVAGFIPKLTGEVAVVVPGFAGGFDDDAGHHFGDVDFAKAFVEEHEGFGQGRELVVVEEDFGVDAHVVGVGKAFVAAGDFVVVEGLRGVVGRGCDGVDGFDAVEIASGGEALVEEFEPGICEVADGRGDEAGDGLRAVGEEVGEFEQGEAAESHAGVIGEVVGVGEVLVEGGFERGQGFFVEAEKQLGRGGRGEDFVEEERETGVGDGVEAEGWFAHFADAFAKRGGVLGAEMGVEAEGHFEFVNRLGGEAGGEDVVEAFEGVVMALEAGDALLDGEAGFHGVGEGAEAGERREVAIGWAGVHKQIGLARGYFREWRNSRVFLLHLRRASRLSKCGLEIGASRLIMGLSADD